MNESGPVVVVIPARLTSRRLPNKPLADLHGKPLVQRTYEQAKRCQRVDNVIVTTPDRQIASACERLGVPWFPSREESPTGTHRCAEIVDRMRMPSLVINWQVDEPLVDPRDMDGMIGHLKNRLWMPEIATLIAPPKKGDEENRDVVKAAVSRDRCWWFSRAGLARSFVHVGVYGFTLMGLKAAAKHPPSELSEAEGLEQLTWIEAGLPIAALSVPDRPLSINTVKDLELARRVVNYD